MPIMPDGSVVPSHIKMTSTPQFSEGDHFNDFTLKFGEVAAVIYPDDDKSISKQFVEYNIWCQFKRQGIGTGRMFYGAIKMNDFASRADKAFQTFRSNPQAGNPKSDKNNPNSQQGVGMGSKVLFQCVNGDANFAVIVGGLPDPKDQSQKAVEKDDITQIRIFNGINWTINNDGELTITYEGKTDNEGKTDVDDSKLGSYFKMDQEGNLKFSDENSKNSLEIDHKNGKVIIKRDKKLEIGDATDWMLLGSSFRDAQKSMDNTLQGQFKTLGNMMQQLCTTASTISSKIVTPVYGAISCAADFAQISVFASVMAQCLQQISSAIQQFEQKAAQKNSFVSDKNKAD